MPVSIEDLNEMLDQLWPEAEARCVEITPDRALVRVGVGANQIRPGGFVSGPTQFAAADLAIWLLVSGARDQVTPMALTSELSIRFLRPAVGADHLMAEAVLERLGRSTMVATARVWTEDEARPCAVAQGSYALPRES